MFKLKKIIYILMVLVTIFTSFSIFLGINKTQAATILPKEEMNLYSKGTIIRCKYKGEPVSVQVVHCSDNKLPAYGLDRTKTSITPSKPYSVNIDGLVTNQRVWRAIVNGYPFKTYKELGCTNELEAYIATKIAVYDAFYNFDLDEFTEYVKGEKNNEYTIKAIKDIITIARSSEQVKTVANIEAKEENSKWQVDDLNNNYISKTYNVTASAPYENYKVSVTGQTINTLKITDTNNNPKTTFSENEKFKILLPIADLKTPGEFTINLTSSLKTYPIFHGKNSNEDYEDFAILAGEYEDIQTTYKQTYEENKTKIKILKQDGDTQSALEGATFNLLDNNKSIIYSDLVTNEKGTIEIPYLMPGLYYLEEVAAPNGYYGYDELIEINLKLQEEIKIIVDNFKEEGDKVVPETPTEEHYTPNKKLPTTGL